MVATCLFAGVSRPQYIYADMAGRTSLLSHQYVLTDQAAEESNHHSYFYQWKNCLATEKVKELVS